jgi:hypothetical protein
MTSSQAKRQATWERLGYAIGAPRDTRREVQTLKLAPIEPQLKAGSRRIIVTPACEACGHPHERGTWCQALECMCLIR